MTLHPAMYNFQLMRAKAYSNLSLKRPLTEKELKEFKSIMEELRG